MIRTSPDDQFDVVVVGAGPAGAAAAIAARRTKPDARVLLLDRADFPRDKACGDGIAPHAVDVLTALRVKDAVKGYRPVLRLRVEAPSGVAAEGVLRRPDWVIPRKVFDARLVAHARRAGVVVARHRVRHVEQRGNGAVIDGELFGRVVVAADGAHSAVRRALGIASNAPDALGIAIRGYAPAAGRTQEIVMRGGDHWPAYAWRFPVGDGTANVGYGALRSRFAGSRTHLVAQMEDTLGSTGVAPDTIRGHPLPMSSSRPPSAVGRVLLAGDAASFVNPLSGEGIYYALLSGALAGRAAVTPGIAARRYQAEAAQMLRRHFRHTGLLARATRNPLLPEAAVAAAQRSPGVFDDLCELTLGRGTITGRLAAGVARHLLR